MNEEEMPDPLPGEWLPEAASADSGDAPSWSARESEILRAAEPRLQELREQAGSGRHMESGPGWLEMARWWRPAAGLAVAAVLALLLTSPVRPEATEAAGSSALGAIVSGGEPTSLWQAVGSEAHPVLALITLDREAP